MPEPHQVDLTRLLQAIRGDDIDPRIVAVVGAAYVETYLKELVRKRLPFTNAEINKRLFKTGNGHIAEFGALIDVARALNAITSRGWNEAIKIARVRNRFAHNLTVDSFDHPDVAPIIDTMDAYRRVQLAADGLYDYDDEDMSRRERFTLLIREFCFSIERALSVAPSWMVGEDDLHVEPHPPSPKKSRGRTRHAPEELVRQSGQLPDAQLLASGT